MTGAVERALSELGAFFEPTLRAIETPQRFALLLRRLGFPFEGAQLAAAINAFGPLRDGAEALLGLSAKVVEDGFRKSDIADLVTAAKPVFEQVATITQPFQNIVPQGMSASQYAQGLQTLPQEFVSLLFADYLTLRAPAVRHALTLIGVYRPVTIPAAGNARSRGLAYISHDFDWSRIGQLFSNPDAWGRDVYGWGVDFDSDKAIGRIADTLRFIGGPGNAEDMPEILISTFVPAAAAGPPVAIRMMKSPILAFSTALNRAELGVAVFPVSDASPATKGLGISPYAQGVLVASTHPADGIDVTIQGSLGAVGGVVFAFQPGKAEVKTGLGTAAFAGSFGAELMIRGQGNSKFLFFGEADKTRIEADAIIARFGGSGSNNGVDIHLAGGLKALTAYIDPGDDGLLSAVISAPIVIKGGDLTLGWRPGKGIYFEGGTQVSINVPVSISLGPVNIHSFGLALGLAEPYSVTVTTSLDLTIGPLFAYAENVGLKATLVKTVNGRFGGNDLDFSFVPPTGYALALKASPIEGGGLLSVGDHEYRGALALKFQTFGFSAFGILNTRLPDGRDGFSFAASIFGEFVVPLGFGFFLTGVGGIIGVNRTIVTDALRAVLYEGRLDNILFPANPIQNASTILADMAAILPPCEGQHVFGPVARIGWGQPTLIEVKLGVVLEVGNEVRILILGALGINLPTKDTALIALNITFFGEIDFGAGTISFDATLVNSRILTFAVGGDAAVRTGWGPHIEHVVSFGGLHPQFPKPANLPDLRRLSISFGSNNPRVTLTAYQALTTNSLQFGARAEAYAKGPDIWLVGQVAAKGWLYFDALIYFDPFSFDAVLGGGLELLVDGEVEAGLHFSLRLRGPNPYSIDGDVWITIFGIDVSFGISHSWGSKRSIPSPSVDAAEVLRAALSQPKMVEPIASGARRSGVTFGKVEGDEVVIDPLGGLRVSQRAVPLNITLDKIGEAPVAPAANRLSLNVFNAAQQVVVVTPVRQEFVHGHFFRTSDAEKLRATAFDLLESGFDFADAGLSGPAALAVEDEYAYEYITIPSEDDNRFWGIEIAKSLSVAKVFADYHLRDALDDITRHPGRMGEKFASKSPIIINPPIFVDQASLAASNVAPNAASGTVVAAGAGFGSFVGAAQSVEHSARPVEANAVIRDYILQAA